MLLQARIELWYAMIAWPIASTLFELTAGHASTPLTVVNELELLVLLKLQHCHKKDEMRAA
jgi:hypothetical protein